MAKVKINDLRAIINKMLDEGDEAPYEKDGVTIINDSRGFVSVSAPSSILDELQRGYDKRYVTAREGNYLSIS
jgi:hypothetical protein